MLIRLIYPKFNKFLHDHPELKESLKDHVVGDYTMPPSLALPIIAALIPPENEVRLTDDNVGQPVDYDEKADLVMISCFTPQAQRAFAIADEYRKRGTKTILGGIHPSARPSESLEHADAVCVGEVEPVLAEILADARAGSLQRIYKAKSPYNLADFPIPRREIFPQGTYKWNAHLVLTMRGCPVKCDGCPIPAKEDVSFRFRPVGHIIDDICGMPYKQFYFTDDTVMLPGKKNMKFLLSIMEQTRDLDVSIFLASTMMMVSDPSFYRKLHDGHVSSMYTVFGFDRVSKRLLSKECTREEWQHGVDLVRMNEDNGIHFFASFGVGFDEQDPGVFERILKFSDDAKIDLAEFYILTPFPGTPFGIRAEQESRILHRNYSLWNHANIVFKPKAFTEKELLDGFAMLWREFYRNKAPRQTLRTFNVVDALEPRQ